MGREVGALGGKKVKQKLAASENKTS